eukprot:COSAG01_NODE_20138_length_969_cov_0.989655_2_plen_131_part_01
MLVWRGGAVGRRYYGESPQLPDGTVIDAGYSEFEASKIARQPVSAVDACHAAGVVHRDLTPNNLFIDREAAGNGGGALCLRIADFGLAERLVGGCESAPNCCGTPSYMPPEVLRSSHISGHEVLSTDGGHS